MSQVLNLQRLEEERKSTEPIVQFSCSSALVVCQSHPV